MPIIFFCFLISLSSFCFFHEAKRIINHIRHSNETLEEMTAYIDSRLSWSTFNKDIMSKFAIRTNFFLTGTFSSNQVIAGKNNWLFYANNIDGNPIGIYEGKNIYTDEEIQNAIRSVKDVSEILKRRNINFSIMFAPDKENIYFEYMPLKYKFSEQNCADKLLEEIEKEGVSVIKIKEKLQKNKEKFVLYYPHDTHWTTSGSFFAAQAFFDFYKISSKNFDEISLSQNYSSKQEADLENLIGLKGLIKNDFIIETPRYFPIPISEEQKQAFFTNNQAKSEKTLLIIGDSFRRALPLHFTDYFKNIYVIHRDFYKKGMLEKIKPDYVIAEYVERYAIQSGNLENLMF